MKNYQVDYLIVGAGILGLAVARSLKKKSPQSEIVIIEKESEIATHATGRSSGVLHSGFYYSQNSLKVKFCLEGNKALTEFCETNNLPISKIGKLVVTTEESELEGLFELERRGKINGCDIKIIDEKEVAEIDPNASTFQKALWSPRTSTVDPITICKVLFSELKLEGVKFLFNCAYLGNGPDYCNTTLGRIQANKIINVAGLYADKIAKDFGFAENLTIVPFKGIYLKYTKNKTDLRTNIYPVPNLKHTFLGVHFTKTVDGTIKIGPTAIPGFWRENYTWNNRFSFEELKEIISLEAKLFLKNSFGFRDLAFQEIRKYSKSHLVSLARKMVKDIDPNGFTEFSKPGIRPQLINTETFDMEMDFLVEGDERSTHILNAISPGFTCSLPFADYVVDKYILKINASQGSEKPDNDIQLGI